MGKWHVPPAPLRTHQDKHSHEIGGGVRVVGNKAASMRRICATTSERAPRLCPVITAYIAHITSNRGNAEPAVPETASGMAPTTNAMGETAGWTAALRHAVLKVQVLRKVYRFGFVQDGTGFGPTRVRAVYYCGATRGSRIHTQRTCSARSFAPINRRVARSPEHPHHKVVGADTRYINVSVCRETNGSEA